MHKLLLALFIILLTACATGKQSIAPLEGDSIQTVIQRLGQPNQTIALANGHQYYVFIRPGYQRYPAARAPVAAVTTTRRGAPLLVAPVALNNNDALEPPPVLCTMIYEVNSQYMIVGTKTKGSCYGPQVLLRSY